MNGRKLRRIRDLPPSKYEVVIVGLCIQRCHRFNDRKDAEESVKREIEELTDPNEAYFRDWETLTWPVPLNYSPEWLLVIAILEDGSPFEVYNGPGALAWENAGPWDDVWDARWISLAELRDLMSQVPESDGLRWQGE